MEQVHATCVALDGRGVLISGPSGAGKSDLALRLMDGGARLVADDRVDLRAADGELMASAPETLSGMLEVRGVGILRVEAQAAAPVALVVELADPGTIERLPVEASVEICGMTVPRIALDPFAASAAAKVRVALDVALGRIMRADD